MQQSNPEDRARPADDSARFITHAAFCFNHINEAFNLAACFTSRRCVAYLGSVVDEDFSPSLPLNPSSPHRLPPSNLVQREEGSLVLSLSSIFTYYYFLLLPRCSLIIAPRLGPVYTCNARGHRPLSPSRRAHTITVIYCITGASLYGPLIAARISDRRCVSKSVENRISYRQPPRQRAAAIVSSRLHRDTSCAIALYKHCKISCNTRKVFSLDLITGSMRSIPSIIYYRETRLRRHPLPPRC